MAPHVPDMRFLALPGSVGRFAPLVHETDAREKIEASMFLSAMNYSGGINFSIKKPGDYRPKATSIISLDAD